MKIRGDRECKSCGTRWSYYEVGSVACPNCGSLHSVGVDDRKEHTAAPVELDLTPVRNRIDDAPLRELVDDAAAACREYVRQQGFIDAGELRPLDDTYLAATELRHVAREIDRSMHSTDAEEFYLLSLLRDADLGDRPPRDEVPGTLAAARGLAYATAVEAYRGDVRAYLDSNPDELASELLGPLDEHRKRIQALDGDVPLATSENLVRAARAVGRYLVDGDESAIVEARSHLDGLDPGA